MVADLGKKVFDLCSNGLVLPEDANAIVEQINQIDAELNILRADHAAEKAAAAEQHAMEKAARASEKAAAKAAEVYSAPVEMTEPVQDAADEVPVAPTLEIEPEQQADDAENNNEVPTLNV